jgi:hypothetical protein
LQKGKPNLKVVFAMIFYHQRPQYVYDNFAIC